MKTGWFQKLNDVIKDPVFFQLSTLPLIVSFYSLASFLVPNWLSQFQASYGKKKTKQNKKQCLPPEEGILINISSKKVEGWLFQKSVIDFPWRRKWQPTPILLPGKSHGWRSLVGYSPWSRKESNVTEQLHFTSHWKNGVLFPRRPSLTGSLARRTLTTVLDLDQSWSTQMS